MKNTRKIGKKLENFACGSLSKTDKNCRLTNNSGAVSNNGDIKHKDFVIECKKRNVENVKVDRKVWLKLCSQIRPDTFKTPLLILENSHNEKWAVLDLKDFLRIIKEKDNGTT